MSIIPQGNDRYQNVFSKNERHLKKTLPNTWLNKYFNITKLDII